MKKRAIEDAKVDADIGHCGKTSLREAFLFDGSMRKALVEGVLQDIKGIVEAKTDGLVEVSYEDFNLVGHEFGFKLCAVRSSRCKKQVFSEATSAIANAVSYAFQGDCEQYDVSISSKGNKLEVELVSNW